MKTKMMLAAVAAIMCHAALFAGNVCTWQGGSGKFSDAAKWDTAPVSGNGDTIRFDTTDGNAITVENDVADDFSVSNVVFCTRKLPDVCGKVTLIGKRLYISDVNDRTIVVWDHGVNPTDTDSSALRGPEVDVALPLRVKSGRFNFSRNVTFKRKVTIDDDGDVALRNPGTGTYTSDKPTVTFEAEVEGAQANLDSTVGAGGNGSDVYYKGKVTLKKFSVCATANGRTLPHLQASENDIPSVWVCYADLYLDSSPCLGTNMVVTRADNQWRNGATYITGGGAGVVCDRLVSNDSTKHQTVGDLNKSGKLTMRASGNASSGFNFTQTLSLVWDPRGAYTNTLTDSASTMSGTLEIKGGTFKMAGTTSFSALSEVIVRSGATLDLSECSAPAPFASTTRLRVSNGGKVVLPAGGGVSFGRGFFGGLPLAAGPYDAGEAWVEDGTVTVLNGPAAGERYWAAAADGRWNEASNWTPAAVPTASDEAFVTVEGSGDYTVHFSGSEAKPARIEVRNAAGKTARLSVDGEANFTSGTAIDVLAGGEIVVPAGGSFVYDMRDQTDKTATKVKIEDGRFVVSGGFASFTNSVGVTRLRGASGEMLVENGGTLVLSDRSNCNANMLTVDGGAKLRMTGGTIAVPSLFYHSYLGLADGACEFSGGTLKIYKADGGQPNCIDFRDDVTLSGTATALFGGDVRMAVGPNVDGKKTKFSALGSATASGDNLTSLAVSGCGFGREAEFRWGATGSFGTILGFVGTCKGESRLVQTAGSLLFGGKGLCAGSTALWRAGGSDASDNATVGTVEISGGTMTVGGEGSVHDTWGWAFGDMFPPGLALGYGGTLNPPAAGRPYVGRMTISGTGCLTNAYGHLFVGVAPYGEGSLVMNGGTLRSGIGIVAKYQEVIGCAVGLGGGKGEFVVNGGDCLVNNNTWIGGATTSALRIMADGEHGADKTYGYPFDVHGGEGLLKVTGGSVAFTRDLVVGAEGTGVVSVEGSAASQFTVGRDLVLSNEAAVVSGGTSSATLKFKADANGVTPINVAGRFAVSEQARLEVDMSAFDLTVGDRIWLVTCNSMSGTFDAGNISVTGCKLGDVRILPNGIYVKERRGATLIFR